jgi:hypothetical protein
VISRALRDGVLRVVNSALRGDSALWIVIGVLCVVIVRCSDGALWIVISRALRDGVLRVVNSALRGDSALWIVIGVLWIVIGVLCVVIVRCSDRCSLRGDSAL